jgi:hypothetical protein
LHPRGLASPLEFIAMPPIEPATPLPLLMPLKGDRTAPTFDPASPHTLLQYLAQVDHLLT